MDHVIEPAGGNLTTDRLVLGGWDQDATERLFRLSNDPLVMRHFPSMPTHEQVEAMTQRHSANLAAGHPGLYAVRLRDTSRFIGFETLGLPEIASFTTVVNEPSIAVMRRLGMNTDPAEDFDNPAVPEGHSVRRHVLYRLAATEWRGRRGRHR